MALEQGTSTMPGAPMHDVPVPRQLWDWARGRRAPLSLVIASAVVDTYATALFVVAGALVVATGLYGLATGVAKRMT